MFGGAVPDAHHGARAHCSPRCTTTTATSRSPGLKAGEAADLDYPEDQLRAESGLLDGVQTDRHRLAAVADLDQAVDHHDRHRRALGGHLLQHAGARRPPPRSRCASPRTRTRARRSRCWSEHLRAHAPWGAQVDVHLDDEGAGFSADAQGPVYDAGPGRVRRRLGRAEPVDIGVGGSIPFVAAFAEKFPDAAILVTGVEDPDTRAHGANESLHLGEFERVCVAEAVLLERLGALPR